MIRDLQLKETNDTDNVCTQDGNQHYRFRSNEDERWKERSVGLGRCTRPPTYSKEHYRQIKGIFSFRPKTKNGSVSCKPLPVERRQKADSSLPLGKAKLYSEASSQSSLHPEKGKEAVQRVRGTHRIRDKTVLIL